MSLVDDFECREFRPSRTRPYTSKPGEAFERPSCPTCNLDMWLIRAEPHAVLTAYDVWSFECPGCKASKELNRRSVEQNAAAVTTALTGVNVIAWALHISGQSKDTSDNRVR